MHRRWLRFMHHAWPLFLTWPMPLACSGSSERIDIPKPQSSASASSAAAQPQPESCQQAAELRAKVQPFLAYGRLHRTVKLIEKADRLCPDSAPETWAALVTTLADLGEYTDARAVAAQIDADARASTEAKAAARSAKEKCDKWDKVFPDTDDAKKEMKRLYLEALAAQEKPDPASQKLAKEKYLAAWEAWRPNGQALLLAGFAAKKLGELPDMQRLFDRAIVDGEKAQNTAVTLDVPNGFSGEISSIAWSKDGRRLAVAHANEISIFDRTWRERFRLLGHRLDVASVAFSPNGKTLASGALEGTVKLWDVTTGSEITTLRDHETMGPMQRPGASVRAVAYSPDGHIVASGSLDTTVKLWNFASKTEIRTLEGHREGIASITFSPDGTTLASGSLDKTIRLWDVASGKHIRSLEGHQQWIRSVTYAPDGKTLASVAGDGAVREWNVATGQLMHEITGRTNSIAYSPDGKFLSTGSVESIKRWDMTSKKLVGDMQKAGDAIGVLGYSPDGNLLAAGVNHYLVFHKVRLWDMTNRTVVRTLEEHTSFHSATTYAPDGKTLAAGFADGTVRLWDVVLGKPLNTLYGHTEAVRSIAYSPDGKILASGAGDKTVRVWNAERGRLLDVFDGHTGPVESVVIAPDGKTLMSYCAYNDYAIYLWDLNAGKLARKLEGHKDSIRQVVYSPDGKTIASASRDQTVRIWSVADGKLVHLLDKHRDVVTSIAYAPDGKTLVSGATDGIALLWDVTTGKLLRTFKTPVPPTGLGSKRGLGDWSPSIRAIAFVDNGQVIASRVDGKSFSTGSDDETTLWNVASGSIIRTVDGAENSVFWGARSPKDATVIVQDDDPNSIRIQRLDKDPINAELRALPIQDASYVLLPSGHIDFFGTDACAARTLPVCRMGTLTFPFEVCEERFYTSWLLARVHSGDTSYLEPENDPPRMICPTSSP